MDFFESFIPGVFVVELDPIEDERGFFARAFCREEFSRRGVDFTPIQANFTHNIRKGTLRGLHFQVPPHAEAKLIRVVRGAAFDVAVDLRPGSRTYCQWFSVELSAANRSSLFIPPGCAHGFLTLEDDTDMVYLVAPGYNAEASREVRWNDPAFGITWPMEQPLVISEKDRLAKDFHP